MSQDVKASKILIIRLSSLGDLVLSQVVLKSPHFKNSKCDWVVENKFKDLLEGQVGIHQVYAFDKKGGLGSWLKLCKKLKNEGYDEVYDLHSSTRSLILRFFFFGAKVKWMQVSKERIKLWGYFLFKGLWPKSFRPTPWLNRFQKIASLSPGTFPDLSALTSELSYSSLKLPFNEKSYLCVMPSSRWPGKEWPAEKYLQLFKDKKINLVLLGTSHDANSVRLANDLNIKKMNFFNAISKYNFKETLLLIKNAKALIGADTGLVHIAQSFGVPSLVLMGPTTADSGFGPWRESSKAIGLDIWCRPCSKDGNACHRITERHKCLTDLAVEDVDIQLTSLLGP